MCGIAGIYNASDADEGRLTALIEKMTQRLSHRGPDDYGLYVDRSVALGHRRLSIIDLHTGHQPIINQKGDKCIVFNGEIYNYQTIKAELQNRGYLFATNSDTETILHAYEEWGIECLHRLTGMFAFCIWDRSAETLFLARDRLGEKPLYYAQHGRQFSFASEIKALLSIPSILRTIDRQALAAYFMFSYIPAPRTIYQSIHKLLPGHYALVKNGHLSIHQYWDVEFVPNRARKEKRCIEEILDLLTNSVHGQLVGEVPLGAFLSGGIDSSTVVAIMSRLSADPVKTFTIGFSCADETYEDERRYAALLAERYRTDHREQVVVPHADGLLAKIVEAFDEPFADDSTVPSYFVYQLARKRVTVALSGLGGDEAFAGYSRYVGYQLSHLHNGFPAWLRKTVGNRMLGTLSDGMWGGFKSSHVKRFVRSAALPDDRRYLGFVAKLLDRYQNTFFSASRGCYAEEVEAAKEEFLKHFNSSQADEPLNRVFYCDLKTYLPDDILTCTDRLSMHHSLEVRVPFLDHKLIEYSATIPPEMKLKPFRGKYLLKKAVGELLPRPIIRHQKQGFVGPTELWLKGELRDFTLEKLSEKQLSAHGLFDHQTITAILDDHYNGRENNDVLIWSLLIFQSWFERCMN